MSKRRLEAPEQVGFRRWTQLPGVEIRDVENSSRRWRCFSTGFEFLAPRTWQGEIRHRRRQQAVVPGMVFCIYPEEIYTTPRILSTGGGSSITIEPEIFAGHLAEHQLEPEKLDMTSFVSMSHELASKMRAVLRLLVADSSPLRLQATLVDLVAGLVGEACAPGLRSAARVHGAAADRVRECLHFDPSASIDLEALAQQTGLSRFQVLRVFKQKFGLPPHAYQLRVRIGLAQRALRAGLPAADVAADHGFADQSHFSRHFKRLVGVTPRAYARGAA